MRGVWPDVFRGTSVHELTQGTHIEWHDLIIIENYFSFSHLMRRILPNHEIRVA